MILQSLFFFIIIFLTIPEFYVIIEIEGDETMDNQSKISIIIPYYETLKETKRLLQILNRQRQGTNIEVILIDDYSNGQELANQVDIYIRNKKNYGVCHSRNVGLNAATGDYITFIDCDDMILENYIWTLIEETKKGNDLTWLSWKCPLGDAVVKDTNQPNIAPWGCLFSKRIFNKIRFDERHNIGEELKFWKKVFYIKNLKIGYTTNMIYYYNIREESLTRRHDRGEIKKMRLNSYLATIFIPVYNQETLVIKALDSLPIRDDLEIIVLNDGSTDNTYPNLLKYKKEHPELKFKIWTYETNRGLGTMKNIIYTKAKGKYIGELDSDDYVYTNEYNKVLEELDDEADIVYMNLLDNRNEIFKLTKDTKQMLCSGICKFIKKDLIGETRCPETNAPGEDWPFNEEIQAKPHIDKFTDIIAYHYNFPREGSLFDTQLKSYIGE